MLNLPILIYLNSPFYYFQTRNFKWPSKQRWQCPIPQGTLHPFWFIMWKILSSLFLGLQLFNSNNSMRNSQLKTINFLNYLFIFYIFIQLQSMKYYKL